MKNPSPKRATDFHNNWIRIWGAVLDARCTKRLRCDNGPEFISSAIKSWLELIGVEVLYIEPASPWQNGLCESFNSRLRDEYLQQTDLLSEEDARISSGLTGGFQQQPSA